MTTSEKDRTATTNAGARGDTTLGTSDAMLGLVYGCLKQLNEQLGNVAAPPATPETVLNEVFGSLELAMLTVNLQDAIRASLGRDVPLGEMEVLMSRTGPMSSVRNLVEFLTRLVPSAA